MQHLYQHTQVQTDSFARAQASVDSIRRIRGGALICLHERTFTVISVTAAGARAAARSEEEVVLQAGRIVAAYWTL
jgi:hypothetical protein